jgi:hypothetical protein
VDGLYGPWSVPDADPLDTIGFPGEPPFTRGIHPTGYRSRLWTMRMFAGFGAAEDTNARFRQLLDADTPTAFRQMRTSTMETGVYTQVSCLLGLLRPGPGGCALTRSPGLEHLHRADRNGRGERAKPVEERATGVSRSRLLAVTEAAPTKFRSLTLLKSVKLNPVGTKRSSRASNCGRMPALALRRGRSEFALLHLWRARENME